MQAVCNPNLEIVLDYLNRSFHYSYIVSKYIDRSDLRKCQKGELVDKIINLKRQFCYTDSVVF